MDSKGLEDGSISLLRHHSKISQSTRTVLLLWIRIEGMEENELGREGWIE